MNLEKTKCFNCDKKLKPHEEITRYRQGEWIGRSYVTSDYFDLCKYCYKKWRKEEESWIKIKKWILVAIIVMEIANLLTTVLLVWYLFQSK